MFRTFAAFVLSAAAPVVVGAQTVDEVIARHLEARGGVERVRALNSLRMTGRMTIGTDASEPFSLELKRPNKTRVEFAVKGQVAVQSFDGTRGWVVMPFAGITEPQVLPPGEPRELAEQADIDGPLLDYRAKGSRAELVGKVKLASGEAFKVKLTLRSGGVRFFFIDAQTGFLVRAEGHRPAAQGASNFVNIFSDHRKVQGLVLPFRVESAPEGSDEKQQLVFSSIELNVPIEESRFAVPAGAKPLKAVEQP
jgi:hypothetical protein